MHVYVKETELYNFCKILPNDPKYKLWMILQFKQQQQKRKMLSRKWDLDDVA